MRTRTPTRMDQRTGRQNVLKISFGWKILWRSGGGIRKKKIKKNYHLRPRYPLEKLFQQSNLKNDA